ARVNVREIDQDAPLGEELDELGAAPGERLAALGDEGGARGPVGVSREMDEPDRDQVAPELVEQIFVTTERSRALHGKKRCVESGLLAGAVAPGSSHEARSISTLKFRAELGELPAE